jgi:hypothetical protein
MHCHHRSIDPGVVAAIVLLFLLPVSSQYMITLVLLVLPASLLVGATGMLLGRRPMLLAATLALVVIAGVMIHIMASSLP